jgi:hypothetical protein
MPFPELPGYFVLFFLAKLNFFQTLHVGTSRLYKRPNSKRKIADDFNIIPVLADIDYPGRIRSVFTINDGESHLLVAYITSLISFTFEIDKKGNFIYANICSIVDTISCFFSL